MEKATYRIFDYCWHSPYQFHMVDALRGYCRFDYCLNNRTHWDHTQRPLPPAIQFVPHYEHGLYDLALLHIDQRLYASTDQRHELYTVLDNYIDDIPKIVINHGSPVFPEAFRQDRSLPSAAEMENTIIRFVQSMIGNNTMVVNSYTAASEAEWNFGIPIIQGFDVDDWPQLPKEPRVFTALPVLELDTYYNRKCLQTAGELLYHKYGYLLHCANYNAPVFNSFDDYRNYLGRTLIYLDTSTRTPMHTARTEAFLSGCCVVQVQGAHDLDRWAKDGENIVLVPNDPSAIAAVIADLLENRYEEALQIGENGRKMAQTVFDQGRYRDEWLGLFKKLKS